MAIVDAQARTLVPTVLRRMAEMVEDQRWEIPFEQSEGSVVMVDKGRSFTEDKTGEKFYSVVYVMIAETQEQIEERTSKLLNISRGT